MLIFTAYRAYEPIECKYVWHLKHEAREVEKDFASEIPLNCKRLHNILHSLFAFSVAFVATRIIISSSLPMIFSLSG